MNKLHPPRYTMKLVRKRFGVGLTNIQSQKMFESKLKRLMVYSTFGSLGIVVYHNFINVNLDLIFTPTELNLEIVNSMRDLKRMKYKSCPLLFHRSMETIYGNNADQRDYCDYDREIIHTADNERIALGYLKRLGIDSC